MLLRLRWLAVGIIVGVLVLGMGVTASLGVGGIGARGHEPGWLETVLARAARSMGIPAGAKGRTSPVLASPEALADGLAHFADHCASCHAIDGSGDTEMNRGLYPRAPDMRRAATQQLTDGELFYIIENGVRLTGMPGWGTGTAAGEEASWRLVLFIRHLPALAAAERDAMQTMTPRAPADVRQEIEEERFLNEGAR
jgi:mono/diheme cytochrome c family protein